MDDTTWAGLTAIATAWGKRAFNDAQIIKEPFLSHALFAGHLGDFLMAVKEFDIPFAMLEDLEILFMGQWR